MPTLTTIKFAIIGVIILAALAYVGYLKYEIKNLQHYKTDYISLVSAQATKAKAIAEADALQDKTRNEQATQAAKTIFELQNQHLKDLHELQSLKSIIVPTAAVSVFNSTTDSSGPNKEGTAGQSNASDAKAGTLVATGDAGVVSLADLLAAVEINKANYEQCAVDKQAWIDLWHQTEVNLNGSSEGDPKAASLGGQHGTP